MAILSDDAIELPRMRLERYARLRSEMARSDVDVLVAIGLANVYYITGATVRASDLARCHDERTLAIVPTPGLTRYSTES